MNEVLGSMKSITPKPQKVTPEVSRHIAAMSRQRTLVRADQQVGRNDPCPCGSGKKAKVCHPEVLKAQYKKWTQEARS